MTRATGAGTRYTHDENGNRVIAPPQEPPVQVHTTEEILGAFLSGGDRSGTPTSRDED